MMATSGGMQCTSYEVIVQPTSLYASETWALPKQLVEELHRLEAFQMKCLRQICKVSLRDIYHINLQEQQ